MSKAKNKAKNNWNDWDLIEDLFKIDLDEDLFKIWLNAKTKKIKTMGKRKMIEKDEKGYRSYFPKAFVEACHSIGLRPRDVLYWAMVELRIRLAGSLKKEDAETGIVDKGQA